jgi:glycosyltransferase involved in cell wall biosynthesis
VSVIAADYLDWARAADKVFSKRSWRLHKTVKFGPDSRPLHRAVQIFRQYSARAALRTGLELSSFARTAFHPIVPDLISAAKKVPADLYIAHYPAALPAAAIAADVHRAKFAFDAEDFHPGDWPPSSAYDFKRRMLRSIEESYLKGCSYITAASPGIADAYAAEYQISRPAVVLNTFPLSHAPAHSTPKGTALPRPSVYWFSQTVGPDRGLECAVRAIGISRSRPHLYLRGKPARGFLENLFVLADEVGVREQIHILPPAEPENMEKLASTYDLGFSGESGHTKNNQIALGNKIFSYLLAGLPVVLSDVPAHRSLVSKLGGAARLYRIGDPISLASVIDTFLCDLCELAQARRAAYELGQTQFNWEAFRPTFLRQVGEVFATSASADRST